MCCNRPERCVGTRHPLTETTTRRKRWQVREATLPDGSARSLQGEFGAWHDLTRGPYSRMA